ncbi:MAG TPA: IgGFc-binding protein [Kofleriaceae bacterium]|nr:IgGFc-binding protein [Kofleriaceae bacterium]
MQGICRALVIGVVVAACGNPSRNDNDNVRPDALNQCTMDGAHRCNGSSYETCTGGQWMSALDCPAFCDEVRGCVECQAGQTYCKGGNVWRCADDGTGGMQTQECTGINVCDAGSCVDACATAAVNKSYIGCDYFAVDLDNALETNGTSNGSCPAGQTSEMLNVCFTQMGGGTVLGQCDPQDDGTAPHTCPAGTTCQSKLVCATDAQHGAFAVVISNPQAKDAHVTITGPQGTQIMKTVTAGQVLPIPMQQGTGIPDQSVEGTGKFRKAYRIQSDIPIVAYQFNPLDNSSAVFSNDASLLIPSATYDTDYYVLTEPTLDRRNSSGGFKDPYYGFMTVVAWQDGTQIAVTPTAAIMPSQTQSAIAAGTTATFTLNAFEVLQLEASGSGDLTGTHITSPNMMSFGVFAGHEATTLDDPRVTSPNPSKYPAGPGYADHLEEMLFPSSTWGKSFAIARTKPRINETDILRIVAQMPGTNVSFTPPLAAPGAPSATPGPVVGTCPALDAGKFCDVFIAGDVEITADKPILVGHMMESDSWIGNSGLIPGATGDPSLAIATPTEQFRKEYTILVPAAYAENYVSIAAAATGGVTVERILPNPMSIPVTLATFPGGGTHRAARVPLSAGQYKITCADGCGIAVYGYSPQVSYMFAGGLDLKPIVIF